jgi:NitT/TauT family transport system ATP-binding protein
MPRSEATGTGRGTQPEVGIESSDNRAETRSSLRVTKVSKTFYTRLKFGQEQATPALADIELSIEPGEFVTVIGPSGSGKSTLLSIVAGLTAQTAGTVHLGAREIAGPGPDRGVVFQEFALFPWLTVWDNIRFGIKAERMGKVREHAIIEELIRLVSLGGFEDYYPHRLSGGMKQRVAIARALAPDPGLLLMDEPFGALDAQTRAGLQAQFERIWQESKKTVLFITHSVREAVLLSDRVIVLSSHPGRVVDEIRIELPRPRQVGSDEFGVVERHLGGSLAAAAGESELSSMFTD